MPKIFSSEHVFSYKNYTFGYAEYAERIDEEPVGPIYALGFLPYSGEDKLSINNLYYMARSARVELDKFSLNSENRRILKKFEAHHFESKKYPAKEFLDNKDMLNFCLKYFEQRHGPGLITEDRLKRILNYSPETEVIEYRDNKGVTRAYVIEISGEDMMHYWFSFYDLSMVYQSFGMWLMISSILDSKEKGRKYCYLGTVYGDKALYKTNFSALEYWNGREWVKDIKSLKNRARTDDERIVTEADEFKLSDSI